MSHRTVLLLALPVLATACQPKTPPGNTFDSDTGLPECGRVRGTSGVLMYDAADPDTIFAPVDQPDDSHFTTGIAGPLADGVTFVMVQSGKVNSSVDGGCNWSEVGTLPADGWWQLRSAGDDLYAFDRDQARGAHSTDAGLSWTPFDPGTAFQGVPMLADSDAHWLRGVTATGVATSTDAGATWTAGGTLPDGATALVTGSISPANLDNLVAGSGVGLYTSENGGTTWTDRTPLLLDLLNTDAVSVPAVAISEDDPSAMAAIATASSGLSTLVQSVDGGATWSRLADSDGIGLDATSGLWIVPGNPDEVVTSWVDAAATDFPLHLNVSLPKTGTHTVKAGWFYGLTQMVFTSERWLASVHGVPPN